MRLMDPFTVIVMLAIHLVGSGCLMFLVWRMMPSSPGLGRWWVSSCLFGLAYIGRLFAGAETVDVPGFAGDAMMLLAVLLFSNGVREFVGRPMLYWQATAGLLIVLVGGEVVAALLGGAQARHVTLSTCLGAVYASVVWAIVVALPRQPMPLRAPLRVLAVILSGMAALVLLRSYSIFAAGMPVAFHGLVAQIFYVYASLCAVVIALTLLWLLFLRLNAQLADVATRDALTGVLNRNGLDERVKHHFERRDPRPLTVLLVDIDHFKRVNDAYGHATGDLLLKAVATALVSQLRVEDFVARVGGEEFLIGCVGAQHDVALALGRRLNERVEALLVVAADGISVVTCTVSVGVSRCVTSMSDWEAAARQADMALYEAKARGRNEVRPFLDTTAMQAFIPAR